MAVYGLDHVTDALSGNGDLAADVKGALSIYIMFCSARRRATHPPPLALPLMRYPDSSPSSSPASSPCLGPVDSSPPSSPALEAISLNDTPPQTPTTLGHPFAASAKATRPPPQYELKPGTSPSSPAHPVPSGARYGRLHSPTRHAHRLPSSDEIVSDMIQRGMASTSSSPALGRRLQMNSPKSENECWEAVIGDAIMDRNRQSRDDKTIIDLRYAFYSIDFEQMGADEASLQRE